MTETIESRNAEIRSLYLKLRGKHRKAYCIKVIKKLCAKWNISEATIRDIVGRRK